MCQKGTLVYVWYILFKWNLWQDYCKESIELGPRRLAKDVGVTLPMVSNKHAYVVTDVVEELKGHGHVPNLRSGMPGVLPSFFTPLLVAKTE